MRSNSMYEIDQSDRLAEARYQKILLNQPQYVWRRFADGEELKAYAFFPKNHTQNKSIPSVVFFHGGMWRTTNMTEFVPWALHLARFGIASILPDYRTFDRYELSCREVLEEAEEAWQWVYENAEELGLDRQGITLAGSDAGGLMAVHAGMSRQVIERRWFKKKVSVDPQPAAIALFRGISDLSATETVDLVRSLDSETLKKVNPGTRLRKKLPPLFSSHGRRDKLLPFKMSEDFAGAWAKTKSPSCFLALDGADHAYYHFNVNAAKFEYVLNQWMCFMKEQDIWALDEMEEELLLL